MLPVLCLLDPLTEISEAQGVFFSSKKVITELTEFINSGWMKWDFGVCGQFVDLIEQ
jgi:hypothetical protein